MKLSQVIVHEIATFRVIEYVHEIRVLV